MRTRDLREIYQSHPAKFSDEVLEMIDYATIFGGAYPLPEGSRIIDPFAGVGKIFSLADDRGWDAVGVEIEPEWAAADPRIICANSKHLPFPDGSFDAAIFSPVYGNRMSDSHEASEKCKLCEGSGLQSDGVEPCGRCKGRGRNVYQRNTYRHRLNRRDAEGNQLNLHPENAGRMHFHQKNYKDLHRVVYAEVTRVTSGAVIINVSDFFRGRDENGSPMRVDVVDWHIRTLEDLGWRVLSKIFEVETKRNRHGANGHLRAEHEIVAVLTKR